MPSARSILMLSGLAAPDDMRARLSCPADMLCLDLEDTVAPQRKEEARRNVVALVNELDWGRKGVAVRINGLASDDAFDDIAAIVEGCGARLNLIFLPMVGSAEQVRLADRLIGYHERKSKLAKPIALLVGVETAAGMLALPEIARASARIAYLGYGLGDLAISLGMPLMRLMQQPDLYPGDVWHQARFSVALAARAAGARMIDTPYVIPGDGDGLRRDAFRGLALGAVGKVVIDPSQAAIANEVFSPTQDEVARARRLLDGYAKLVAAGEGSGMVDGIPVDAVIVGMMNEIMSRHEAATAMGG